MVAIESSSNCFVLTLPAIFDFASSRFATTSRNLIESALAYRHHSQARNARSRQRRQ